MYIASLPDGRAARADHVFGAAFKPPKKPMVITDGDDLVDTVWKPREVSPDYRFDTRRQALSRDVLIV